MYSGTSVQERFRVIFIILLNLLLSPKYEKNI